MQLIDIKIIEGRIELKTGLHIGAGDVEMQIGGTDLPVIKHPHTLKPYIPGSSIKGKVRSLLELRSGMMGRTGGKPLQGKDYQESAEPQKGMCACIIKVFGSSGSETELADIFGPTRVSFSDCFLSAVQDRDLITEQLALTEVKSENDINRITGTARAPRFIERVPPGLYFDFSVALKVLGPDEEPLFQTLMEGLKLLEMDALGGHGSRGYGKIKFHLNDPEIQKQFDELNPFPEAEV